MSMQFLMAATCNLVVWLGKMKAIKIIADQEGYEKIEEQMESRCAIQNFKFESESG